MKTTTLLFAIPFVLATAACGTVSKNHVTDIQLTDDGRVQSVERCEVEYDRFWGTTEVKDCKTEARGESK